MSQFAVNVTVKGPLFTKKLDSVVRNAMYTECIERMGQEQARKYERLRARQGTWPSGRSKYPAVKATPMRFEGTGGLEGKLVTHLASIRTSGRKWQEKNIAAIRRMAPPMLRKAAKRIVGELS